MTTVLTNRRLFGLNVTPSRPRGIKVEASASPFLTDGHGGAQYATYHLSDIVGKDGSPCPNCDHARILKVPRAPQRWKDPFCRSCGRVR